jgi:hypothetical protein
MRITCHYNKQVGTPYSIYLWRCIETSWYSLIKTVPKTRNVRKIATTVPSAQSEVKGQQLTKRHAKWKLVSAAHHYVCPIISITLNRTLTI